MGEQPAGDLGPRSGPLAAAPPGSRSGWPTASPRTTSPRPSG